MGNNEPLVITREMWMPTNPGYVGLVVKQITDDPRYGKTTTELVNFVEGKPDESQFEPPAGYQIVTQEPSGAACPGATVSDQQPAGDAAAPTQAPTEQEPEP